MCGNGAAGVGGGARRRSRSGCRWGPCADPPRGKTVAAAPHSPTPGLLPPTGAPLLANGRLHFCACLLPCLLVLSRRSLCIPVLYCKRLSFNFSGFQVGAGGIKALTQQREPMTMDEILELLTVKARIEAEDSQRLLLGALNGLAAIFLIQDAKVDAVKMYRTALTLGTYTIRRLLRSPILTAVSEGASDGPLSSSRWFCFNS